MAWLTAPDADVGFTASDHDKFVPNYDARVEARALLEGMTGSEWLFELERPVDTSKEAGDEPADFK